MWYLLEQPWSWQTPRVTIVSHFYTTDRPQGLEVWSIVPGLLRWSGIPTGPDRRLRMGSPFNSRWIWAWQNERVPPASATLAAGPAWTQLGESVFILTQAISLRRSHSHVLEHVPLNADPCLTGSCTTCRIYRLGLYFCTCWKYLTQYPLQNDFFFSFSEPLEFPPITSNCVCLTFVKLAAWETWSVHFELKPCIQQQNKTEHVSFCSSYL